MALYRVLPDQVKPLCSPWCEVHIPLLELRVKLPLWNEDGEIRYDITLQSVHNAVISVLQQDEHWKKLIDSGFKNNHQLGMCWSRGNRTEWVYWNRSLTDPQERIDLVISPQHIEQVMQQDVIHQDQMDLYAGIRHTDLNYDMLTTLPATYGWRMIRSCR